MAHKTTTPKPAAKPKTNPNRRRGRRRKKNIGVGGVVAIGIIAVILVPATVAGVVFYYAMKKGKATLSEIDEQLQLFSGEIKQSGTLAGGRTWESRIYSTTPGARAADPLWKFDFSAVNTSTGQTYENHSDAGDLTFSEADSLVSQSKGIARTI